MVLDKLLALFRSTKGDARRFGASKHPAESSIPYEEGMALIQIKAHGPSFLSSLPPQDVAGGISFATWLSDEEKRSLPVLPAPAYLGVLVHREKQGKPNIFLTNSAYVEFLHQSVAEIVPRLPHFVASIRGQKTGTVFIFDGRFRDDYKSIPSENLPRAEIIGVFGITDGAIAASSYLLNSNYKVWSPLGLAQPPPYLRAWCVDELGRMVSASSGTSTRPTAP